MKLKYEAEGKGSFAFEMEGGRNAERKNRWHDKLYDVAARFGENVARVACIVAVPAVIAAGAAGCYSSYQRHGENLPVDSSTDTVHETDAADTVEEDVPEEELPPVCTDLSETATIDNLIGDYLNRRLGDRIPNTPDDTDAAYPLATSETNANANPFADGMGGSLGPTEIFMHRVTGATFTPLANSTVVDENAARSYTQSQNIWINGSSYYSEPANEVVGDARFIAYNAKFSGSSDDFGVPVCTIDADGDYTACKVGAPGGNYDYATELHRVMLDFLGSKWLVLETSPPVIEVTNEMKVQNGGYVRLGKARVGADGILMAGTSFVVDGYTFKLYDVEMHEPMGPAAIIQVFNPAGVEVKRDKVFRGETKEFNVEGHVFKMHAFNVAPGYTLESRWADLVILSDELKIMDGQRLDPDTDRFPGWHSVVGWKNKGATLTSAMPDHLRTMAIYADDVADVSTSEDEQLLRGDGVAFPTDDLAICYGGLDIADDERSTLTFTLERASDFEYESEDSYLTVYAPYVKVVSEIPFASFVTPETNVVYIAVSGAEFKLFEDVNVLEPGASIAIYPGGEGWIAVGYDPGLAISLIAGEPDEPAVSIDWARWEDGSAGYVDPTRAVDRTPSFVFKIKEIAGGNVSLSDAAVYFATDGNSFNLDVRYLDTDEQVFWSNHIVYGGAGPVQTRGTFMFRTEGTITERGSVFRTIDDTQVVFDIANHVGYSVFYVGKKE